LAGNMLGDGDLDLLKKGVGPFRGPIRGKIRNFFFTNLQKSSSHEPLARMYSYLAWNILGARRFKGGVHFWPTQRFCSYFTTMLLDCRQY